MRSGLVLSILCLACSISLFSCLSSPSFPASPVIAFVSVDKTNINQINPNSNQPGDSVRLVFSFTDGDGDLGVLPGTKDTTTNVFVTDVRHGKPPFTYPYRLPNITPNGQVKDISGQVTITLPGVYCIPNKNTDTVTYKIAIKDRAGHISNTIDSPPITVNCQ